MTETQNVEFELPRKIEKLVAILAKNYQSKKEYNIEKILVNAEIQIKEGWEYDGWNGGTYGHVIYLHVSAPLYLQVFDSLDSVTADICKQINNISNVQNEYIYQVFIEAKEDETLKGWREKSGALVNKSLLIAQDKDGLDKLWMPGFLKFFISHKAEYKEESVKLKKAFELFGISCFVAHEDIEPNEEWQIEIEKALRSMDVLVALMTDEFSRSNWTDQEIGFALGRNVPVIPVRIGTVPYGFIGKIQAVSGLNKTPIQLRKQLYDILWKIPSLKEKLTESLITRFESSGSFENAKTLMSYMLERIESATPNQIKRLIVANENNSQVAGSYYVQKHLPTLIKKLKNI